MTFKPAHKDTETPAGQIRPTDAELKGQQTLSDYIRSIKRAEAFDAVAAEKKITFDEWWNEIVYTGRPRYAEWNHLNGESARLIWHAALKHGKVS